MMLSVVVLCLLFTKAWTSVPQLTRPNGEIDPTSLTNYILHLEQSLSEVKSASQTQEQKYAAVLSSVLSKLTSTEKELDSLKSDHNLTKSELEVVKADLDAKKAELNLTRDNLKRATDSLTSSESKLSSVAADVTGLNIWLNSSQSSITKLTSDLSKIGIDVMKADETLTWNLTFALSEVHNTNSELKSLQTTIQRTQSTCQSLSAEQTNLKSQITQFQHIASVLQSGSQPNGTDVAFQVTAKHTQSRHEESALIFDKVEYNAGDGYNRTTGIFTAPVSGTYIFWANVAFAKDSDGYNIYIHQGEHIIATGFDNQQPSTIAAIHLNTGETIHFTKEKSAADIETSNRSSYGGALLHES